MDPKLETYLTALDRALGQVPNSSRADIIMEIKTHVLDAREKHPERSVAELLAALGQPETVANRYLMERGLKPGKAPKSPAVKWLTIGFLGTMGLILLAITLLVWKLTPLFAVDEANSRVQFLGGLISISGSDRQVRMGHVAIDGGRGGKGDFEDSGRYVVSDPGEVTTTVTFTNAELDLRYVDGGELAWECEISAPATVDLKPMRQGDELAFDLSGIQDGRCALSLPRGKQTVVRGSNGDLDVELDRVPIVAELANGRVTLAPKQNQAYRFDLQVGNGAVDDFESSAAPDATPVKVKVSNGTIFAGAPY